MSLTSPKFLPAPAVQWIHGKREGLEAAVSEVCVHRVSRGRQRPWSNAVPLLPIPISFPHHFSLCSKNICTYDTLLHVGCSPSVVLRGKRRKKQKAKQEEKLFPVILYFWVSSSGLCSPGRGFAAPEWEVGSWNCALCRGFLWLMWIKKGKHVWICQSHSPLPVPRGCALPVPLPAPGAGGCLGSVWRSQLCGVCGSPTPCSSLSLLGHKQTGWTPTLPIPRWICISFLVSLFLFQQANGVAAAPGGIMSRLSRGLGGVGGLHSGCCEDPNPFVSTRVMLHNTDPRGSVSIPTCSVRWTFVESLFL